MTNLPKSLIEQQEEYTFPVLNNVSNNNQQTEHVNLLN